MSMQNRDTRAFSYDLVFSLSLIMLMSLAKSLNFSCNSSFKPTGPPYPPVIGGHDVTALIEDQDVMITCTSTGRPYPAPTIRWRLDGDIVSDNSVSITETTVTDDERSTVDVVSACRFRANREWNQRTIQCEVTHEALQEPQEVDVPITVLCKC